MNHSSIFHQTATALFIAILLLLFLTPLGLIQVAGINLTTLCIPVVAGTIILGLKGGLVLGVCFGLFSALSAFGILKPPSPLVATLVGASPVLAILLCMLPRLCIPIVTMLIYKLVARGEDRSIVAVPFATVCGSLTNTVLYMGGMYLCYLIAGLDATPVTASLLVVVPGAIGEAVLATLLSTSVIAAIWKMPKR